MQKIKAVSMTFRILFQIIFICLFMMHVIGWVYAPQYNKLFDVIPTVYTPYIFNSLTHSVKIAGFLITAIPMATKMLITYFLIKLFQLYENNEYFTVNNAKYISFAGYTLLLLQLIKPITEFLLGFVLTATNPPGMRLAAATLSSSNIGLILTSLIIILISWITAEACRLHNEQQLTI